MRNLRLYIGGFEVDLSDDSLILMNYTQEDLSNPTIVKNTYSQRVKIHGTRRNNSIFGDIWRTDRVTLGGFDATRKTPFTIYAESGEILESGYAKLDDITRDGDVVEYSVSLFGGLGSFLYALSYGDSGDKLTLADLDYIGGGDDELNFNINADWVGQSWGALLFPDRPHNPIYETINFAPCYNGLPDGGFSADKGIIKPEECGLPIPSGYQARNGYTLVNMPKAQDEWAVKDLRSYLQRPVFSIRKFLEAIAKPENNGGYSVDVSAVLDEQIVGKENANLWLTLPMLPSLKALQQSSGKVSAVLNSTMTTAESIATYEVQGLDNLPSGVKISGEFSFDYLVQVPASVDPTTTPILYPDGTDQYSEFGYITLASVAFLQVIGYNAEGNPIEASKVQAVGEIPERMSVNQLADRVGFKPRWLKDDTFNIKAIRDQEFQFAYLAQTPVYRMTKPITINVPSGANISQYRVYADTYWWSITEGRWESGYRKGDNSLRLFRDKRITQGTLRPVVTEGTSLQEEATTITYKTQDKARSNTLVTKKALLSTKATPADYLLSLCKTLGYYITYDKRTREVRIVPRNLLYRDRVVDIDDRVDRGTPMQIQPVGFDSKWYELKNEGVGGAFGKAYKENEGRDYGVARINTGYEFNTQVKNLTDKIAFKSAVPSLERGSYFNILTDGSLFIPSPFLDKGNTYTLWETASGSGEDFPIATPSGAVIEGAEYYNNTFKGFDVEGANKLQLHDISGKTISGENVLCFLADFKYYKNFKLSDDIVAMEVLNDGTPCWDLSKGAGLNMPIFSRYKVEADTITRSLDFGRPTLLNIPAVAYDENATIYARCWRNYIGDRYDTDSRVVRVKVNASGVDVGQDLLRQFYWFDGAIWVLNKITNYSMTTDDLTECEFVKVKDKANYINGQNFTK